MGHSPLYLLTTTQPTKVTKIANVLMCSGGKTSGFMLRQQLDANPNYRDEWITIFCNTGREMPQTLDFVHEMETRWQVPIVWLEYTRVPAASIQAGIFPTPRRNLNLAKAAERGEHTHWFRIVNYETASRNGEPFDELLDWMTALPNVVSRVCSVQLKMRTAMRYLFSIGVTGYNVSVGIRTDESHRAAQILASCDSYEQPRFPLIDGKIDERDVLEFWKSNDFTLELEPHQGNCDFCFLKAKWKRVLMAQENPDKLIWWKQWESTKSNKGNGGLFRLGEPYALIEALAKEPTAKIKEQIRLAKEPDIPCSCAEKGFEQLAFDEL